MAQTCPPQFEDRVVEMELWQQNRGLCLFFKGKGLLFLFLFFDLFEGQGDREGKRDLSFTDLFTKCLQKPALGQAKARTRYSILVFLVGWHPSMQMATAFQHLSRKLNSNWSSQDLNKHSDNASVIRGGLTCYATATIQSSLVTVIVVSCFIYGYAASHFGYSLVHTNFSSALSIVLIR